MRLGISPEPTVANKRCMGTTIKTVLITLSQKLGSIWHWRQRVLAWTMPATTTQTWQATSTPWSLSTMEPALECSTRWPSRQIYSKRNGCSRTRVTIMRAETNRWITMSSQCLIRASLSSTRRTKCRCSSTSRWWYSSNRSRNTTRTAPTSWSHPSQRAATSTSRPLSLRKTSDNSKTCSSSSSRVMSRNGTRSLIHPASKMLSLNRTSSPSLSRVITRCWGQRILLRRKPVRRGRRRPAT